LSPSSHADFFTDRIVIVGDECAKVEGGCWIERGYIPPVWNMKRRE
jgi:hypothetical protein